MHLYYGLISSFVFASSYSTLGVWAGVLSGKMNRKILLGVSCILWSLTSVGAGAINSFVFFILMRFALGAFESACNPASYSIIADYFPPAYRSTANAIETSGSYVGGGIASFSVILIAKYGWRGMYQILGWLGVIVGAASLFLIKEPKRGVFDLQKQYELKTDCDEKDKIIEAEAVGAKKAGPFKEFKDALTKVVANPVTKWVTIAGCFRFFETFSIIYFLPSFF